MSKILVLGELKGLSLWSRLDFSKYDNIVFVGDLASTGAISTPIEEWNNFNRLLMLKKQFPNLIKLLLGPNDLAYMLPAMFGKDIRTNHDPFEPNFRNAFRAEKSMFDLVFQVGDWMISWGGVTKYWLATIMPELVTRGYPNATSNLGEWINKFKYTDLLPKLFYESNDMDGFSCPVVTIPTEIEKHFAKGLTQVVQGRKSNELTRSKLTNTNDLLTINFLDERKPNADYKLLVISTKP